MGTSLMRPIGGARAAWVPLLASTIALRSLVGRGGTLLAGVSLGAVVTLASGAAQAQSGPFLYVPNNSSSNVSVIDTSTNLVTGGAIPVAISPLWAAVMGDQSFVYVTKNTSASLSVISTATNTVVATIPVGNAPTGVAVNPDGKTVYVTNQSDNTVSVISTAINTVVATIPVGNAQRAWP